MLGSVVGSVLSMYLAVVKQSSDIFCHWRTPLSFHSRPKRHPP